MNFVERARLFLGEAHHPRGNDPEAGLLEMRNYLPAFPRIEGVGLDDCQGSATSHGGDRSYRVACLSKSTTSIGRLATAIPLSSKACIFSAAVPVDPEMIAPAWPIRRPGGAVCPAMNPTTGLVIFSLTNRAASCSSVPPISPIMTTALVSGSFSKAARQSMKLVPLIGSPPIPTQVVWPRLARVIW